MNRLTHNMNRLTRILILLFTAVTAAAFVSCSTTKRLGEDEVLYNGMKIKITAAGDDKVPAGVKSDLTKAVDVKPNNPIPFLRPYIRSPFPYGLWIYNAWGDSCRGLKKWIYDKLGERPVLLSDVRPDVRLQMLKTVMNNSGYFSGRADYEIQYKKKNDKIAGLRYDVQLGRPYLIDSLIYLTQDTAGRIREDHVMRTLGHYIDSVARKSAYLKVGEQFNVDSLVSERVRITNILRNRGWFYFRPEYIEFLADSLINPGSIALKLSLVENMPRMAALQYRVGSITTMVQRRSNRRTNNVDTFQTSRGEVIVERPSRLRKGLLPECITFRHNKLFSVRDMNRTQTRLSRLGIFGNINISALPVDTSEYDPRLDVLITCQFDRPMEATLQANITSKSNSYLGPGLIFGITHNNLFGGAEKLNVQLSGSYEWETGRKRNNAMNSYEIGLSGSLAFPRLLAPKFVKRSRRDLNWTTITLSGDLLNRPHYFRIAEVKLGITYDWNHSRNVVNSFTPFKLTYSKLLKTTHTFDSIMQENPAVGLSFESQFIPVMQYTYTFDKWLERARINGINFTTTVMEGGNIFWGLWRACGVKGRKELFGMPFSQFVKAQAQLVYSRRLSRFHDLWLVSRLLVGAEHAYGNSSEVPYSEQFYIGGANSLRAWTVRSLGPGSYRAPKELRNGYFDQTGAFKFEVNTEFRFPIISILHGALFVDAGNIWLFKNDPARPGGMLTAKNFGKDIALGTGVGLRVDIGMMVIRGDLGYGLHAPYDTGMSGYFNIKPKNAFAFHLAIGYPF